MEAISKVKDRLDQLGINIDVVEHPPALTTEQADSYVEGSRRVRTKSMFLTNKDQYYLLIMEPETLGYGGFPKTQVGANRIVWLN